MDKDRDREEFLAMSSEDDEFVARLLKARDAIEADMRAGIQPSSVPPGMSEDETEAYLTLPASAYSIDRLGPDEGMRFLRMLSDRNMRTTH